MGKIIVSNLGKAYKAYPSKWGRLIEWLSFGSVKKHTSKWVLQDINFVVSAGEAVGIIGINGAGKSTLLKMITGTTIPTTGKAQTFGRVTAMLELGMGFHPDFTGRQNVMMAGQMIGLAANELETLMPEIEAFAEIGDYIDQPVRVYSSGMQVRLAFSLATAKRPDILIVDEALSVGDAYFQHKSFDRIKKFSEKGTTLLFVSHDKSAIQSICDRAILINSGRFEMEGPPESVFDFYNALLANHQNQTINKTQGDGQKLTIDSGTLEAEIFSFKLLDQQNNERKVVYVGDNVRMQIGVRINKAIDSLVLGVGIKDRLGQVVFGTNTFYSNQKLRHLKAGSLYTFYIDFIAHIGEGSYSIQCALVENQSHVEKNYHWVERAVVFEVINSNFPVFAGTAWLENKISIEQHQ